MDNRGRIGTGVAIQNKMVWRSNKSLKGASILNSSLYFQVFMEHPVIIPIIEEDFQSFKRFVKITNDSGFSQGTFLVWDMQITNE